MTTISMHLAKLSPSCPVSDSPLGNGDVDVKLEGSDSKKSESGTQAAQNKS